MASRISLLDRKKYARFDRCSNLDRRAVTFLSREEGRKKRKGRRRKKKGETYKNIRRTRGHDDTSPDVKTSGTTSSESD